MTRGITEAGSTLGITEDGMIRGTQAYTGDGDTLGILTTAAGTEAGTHIGDTRIIRATCRDLSESRERTDITDRAMKRKVRQG